MVGRVQSKRNTLSDANQVIVESKLADIAEKRTCCQDTVPATKNEHSEAKKQFTDEKKKPEKWESIWATHIYKNG
jgi:hypothetical protein